MIVSYVLDGSICSLNYVLVKDLLKHLFDYVLDVVSTVYPVFSKDEMEYMLLCDMYLVMASCC